MHVKSIIQHLDASRKSILTPHKHGENTKISANNSKIIASVSQSVEIDTTISEGGERERERERERDGGGGGRRRRSEEEADWATAVGGGMGEVTDEPMTWEIRLKKDFCLKSKSIFHFVHKLNT